jgi:hypothetical protein
MRHSSLVIASFIDGASASRGRAFILRAQHSTVAQPLRVRQKEGIVAV